MKRCRRTNLRAAIAVSLCLLGLAACSSIPRELASPRVQLASLELLAATRDSQRFAVTLSVDNPNAFEIPLSGVEFSARLSGQGVLIGESSEPATLPARGNEMLRVEVTTEIVSSFSSLLAVLEGPGSGMPYELNGELRLASGMDRRVRFRYSGRVPLSRADGAAP